MPSYNTSNSVDSWMLRLSLLGHADIFKNKIGVNTVNLLENDNCPQSQKGVIVMQ